MWPPVRAEATFGIRKTRYEAALVDISEGGAAIPEAYAVGGGSRSEQWLQIIANISGLRVLLAEKGEYGAALGAARLAIVAHGGYRDEIFAKPKVHRAFEPEPELEGAYAERYALYRQACLFERELRRVNDQ
jgi:xylulokinase